MLFHTITTYASSVPPWVVATVLGLGYVFVAGGKWGWPMLLDAALIGLYLLQPRLLLVVLFVGCVRHVPALAREVVVIFNLTQYDGWTLRLILFLLPALKRYTNQSAPVDQASLPPMVAPPVVAPPSPSPSEPEPLPMLANEWLQALNSDQTAPHAGVIGATRLGKTTFVGVVVAYRESDLVIATPKAQQYDPWFGADVARPIIAGDAMSYAPIEHAVSTVYQEMLRRNAPGGSAMPAITLIIDEWPQVVGELPGLAKKVINLLRMGAGCGIRLILMATDVNVRGWKMDGVAGVLDNLVFAKVEEGRKWSLGRLDANWRLVSPRRLDTGLVWGLAQRVSLGGRGWAGARVPVGGDGGDLLGGLLSAPVGVRVPVGGVGGMLPDPASQTHTNAHKQTHTEADQRIAMYRTWRAAGIKRDQARLIRQGSGDGLDDKEWAEAGKEPTP